ncbi:MAG: 4Fe-4S dicluster domain-containing protein [Deltaproteobacteria bacterium]|nr:4Fe-4S dicluster domain-containing protein [Deltaproteobacteria bacterium]
MTKLPFLYFDSAVCSGCKTCVVACLDGRNDDTDHPRRNVIEYCGGSFRQRGDGAFVQDVYAYYLSISCHHCSEPLCLKACPNKALRKEPSGLVTLVGDCLGCRNCRTACPYDAPVFDLKTGKLDKCDFCIDRLNSKQAPLCVEACPLGALTLIEETDLENIDEDDLMVAPPPLPPWSLTKPRLMVGWPKRFTRADIEKLRDGRVANPEEK